ncbi:hypothetical protein J6590_019169 [Homalodisca vitripennis]|nr:hypothetical protein J6590_019169 [Homalodisca vitripennis]
MPEHVEGGVSEGEGGVATSCIAALHATLRQTAAVRGLRHRSTTRGQATPLSPPEAYLLLALACSARGPFVCEVVLLAAAATDPWILTDRFVLQPLQARPSA